MTETPDQSVPSRTIKTVCFDFMGTCLDWHATIVAVLPQQIPESVRSRFALEWRQAYFDRNAGLIRDKKPTEDFDLTLEITLEQMLQRGRVDQTLFTPELKRELVTAWHRQKAWDDVGPAVERLKEQGYEVVVYANGTTRLQLDLCRSSGLKFHMLFSSQLLGSYKPAPENYEKFLQLVQRKGPECVMVAAHAYDVRGAAKVGMKTVYIRRWTDDIEEDMEQVRTENDYFLDDMTRLDAVINLFK